MSVYTRFPNQAARSVLQGYAGDVSGMKHDLTITPSPFSSYRITFVVILQSRNEQYIVTLYKTHRDQQIKSWQYTYQVPSDSQATCLSARSKTDVSRTSDGYQKAALSTVSNVTVKFVSQEAPAGVQPGRSVVFSHNYSCYGVTPDRWRSEDRRPAD